VLYLTGRVAPRALTAGEQNSRLQCSPSASALRLQKTNGFYNDRVMFRNDISASHLNNDVRLNAHADKLAAVRKAVMLCTKSG
jgi:hypothetical protein